MPDAASTRRGFLAAAGATLCAGCSNLNLFSDGFRESIPSHRLPDVTDDGESEPVVVDALPVDIERGKLDGATQRVADLLGTLPMPFGSAEIPNGHIRHQLLEAANEATANVEDARTAQSHLSALQSLRQARTHARYAAAGWAFVDSGTTKEDLQAEHQQAISEAQSFQTEYEYLGADLVHAVLVHAQLEENLNSALNDQGPSAYRDSGPLLTVAEWGEHAESARTLVADSRYLYSQFTSSLPTAAGTVKDTFATAADHLEADLQNRQENLPPEPTEGDRESLWQLQYRLHDAADSSADQVAGAAGPASAVLTATKGLADFLAYDRIQDQIENGEQFHVEEASDIRVARSQALEAIHTAMDESPRPDLARPVLADAAVTVAFADEELARSRGDVSPAQLADPLHRYMTATAQARSIPTASQQVLNELGT